MSIALTWLSHATWLIEVDSHRLLLDPFLTDNPVAEVTAESLESISHVLVSHGHSDHIADAEVIARQNRCPIVANFEISQWFTAKGFGSDGLPEPIAMNTGGQIQLPFGTLKMVPALHSSGLPDGTYGGSAAGFVLSAGKRSIYFACDTAYYSDMRYFAQGVDLVVLPIGDRFTMGIDDSVRAIRLIEPRVAVPSHYGTWPMIEQNPHAWAKKVRENTATKPMVLGIGERYEW